MAIYIREKPMIVGGKKVKKPKWGKWKALDSTPQKMSRSSMRKKFGWGFYI